MASVDTLPQPLKAVNPERLREQALARFAEAQAEQQAANEQRERESLNGARRNFYHDARKALGIELDTSECVYHGDQERRWPLLGYVPFGEFLLGYQSHGQYAGVHLLQPCPCGKPATVCHIDAYEPQNALYYIGEALNRRAGETILCDGCYDRKREEERPAVPVAAITTAEPMLGSDAHFLSALRAWLRGEAGGEE